MFERFNGLPFHALIVHAVVVLIPMSAIGVIAIAVRRDWRRTYGWLVLLATTGSLILVPITTRSGKYLRDQLGFPSDGTFRHGQLGAQLIYFVVPFWLLSVALVVLDRRVPSRGRSLRAQGWPLIAVAALASVAGLATTAQVARIGDSGAHAVWDGKLK